MLWSSPIFSSLGPLPMNLPTAHPNALARRLTTAAVGLQLLGAILVQLYLISAGPLAALTREAFARPDMVASTVVNIVAGCILVGLTTWGATQRWLRRHNAGGVDRPGRMVAVLLAVSLVLFVLISTGLALLNHGFYALIVRHKEWVDQAFGYYGTRRMLLMALPPKLCAILLTILGSWLAVRIAAWSVTPVAATQAPFLQRRHAAWIAALTLLLWQLHVALVIGLYFMSDAGSAGMLEHAIGYWIVPALLLALAAWVCLRSLPQALGTAGMGRAIAHGTFAFWLTQALGIGLALLIIWTMTWSPLMRAAASYTTSVVSVLIYSVLLALSCYLGARLFYRRRTPPESASA